VTVTPSFRSAYRREVKKIWHFLRHQPWRDGVASSHNIFYPSHNIFYRLGVRRRNDFERAIAPRAVPKMTYLPLIPIFGPFRGNQLFVASNAICAEARTTFGRCHSHGDSPAVDCDIARGGNRSMAHGSATTHLNLTQELRTFLCSSKRISRI
jgi:hypothetical protein